MLKADLNSKTPILTDYNPNVSYCFLTTSEKMYPDKSKVESIKCTCPSIIHNCNSVAQTKNALVILFAEA